MKNLQEQVKKAFFYKIGPFEYINCSTDLKKKFLIPRTIFSHSSLEQFW